MDFIRLVLPSRKKRLQSPAESHVWRLDAHGGLPDLETVHESQQGCSSESVHGATEQQEFNTDQNALTEDLNLRRLASEERKKKLQKLLEEHVELAKGLHEMKISSEQQDQNGGKVPIEDVVDKEQEIAGQEKNEPPWKEKVQQLQAEKLEIQTRLIESSFSKSTKKEEMSSLKQRMILYRHRTKMALLLLDKENRHNISALERDKMNLQRGLREESSKNDDLRLLLVD